MKTKGGRAMNPTDAFRKEQRKKEINRNKLERKLQREAAQKKADPQKLKKELSDIIALEDQRDGALTQAQRLKKKALLQQYDAAVKQQREEQARKALEQRHGASSAAAASASLWHGAPVRRPEDSVYYHPTKNPTGAPPPGKPQRYKDDVDMAGMIQPGAAPPVLMPAKPPLPAGPAPASTFVLQAPERPPQPAAPQPSASPAPAAPLPPPPGPPPGVAPDAGTSGSQLPLPPPPGPPPGMLPPPAAPPPGAAMAAMGVAALAPPPGPPPIMPLLPPPAGPPPGPPQQLLPRKEVRSVISGQSTAKPRVLAQNDKTLTCLIPASVRVKRQGAAASPAKAPAAGGAKAASHRQDDQYMDFLKDMKELGAFKAL